MTGGCGDGAFGAVERVRPIVRQARSTAAVALSGLLFAGTAWAAVTVAEPGWLSEAEMQQAFAGTTLEGRYGNGRPFTESYHHDGRIEYQERGNIVRGRWSLESGTFCTIYDVDPTGGCYRVKKVKANCFEFYFVARTQQQAREDQRDPSWTARGSVSGRPGSCAEESIV